MNSSPVCLITFSFFFFVHPFIKRRRVLTIEVTEVSGRLFLGLLTTRSVPPSRRLQSWLSTAPRSLCWRRPRESRRKRLSHGRARWVSSTPSKNARAPSSCRDYLKNVTTTRIFLPFSVFVVITSLFFHCLSTVQSAFYSFI